MLSRSPKVKQWLLLGLVSALIAGGFWWLLRKGAMPLVPTSEQLQRVDLLELVGFSCLWLLVLALRAWRWRFQLAPIGHVPTQRVMAATLLGMGGVLLFPLRSGEFVRPASISRNSPIPFLAAMSTSATERLVDALFASGILLFSLAGAVVIDPLPDHIGKLPIPAAVVPGLGYSAASVTLLAIALVLLFFYFRAGTIKLLSATIGRVSPGFGKWIEGKLVELAQGLDFLGRPKETLRYLAVSAMYWGAHLLSTWFMLRAAGFSTLTLVQAGVILGTLSFGMSLPNAPGFFGVFQVSIYASLALFFEPDAIQEYGTAGVFWLYVLELGWVFLLCPFALLVERAAWNAGPTPAPAEQLRGG